MRHFEVSVEGMPPKVIAADYWVVEDGMLVFCNKVRGDECPDVAAFAPGSWLCVTPVPGAERPEGDGDPA